MSDSMVDRVARAMGEKIAPALQPGGEPVRVKDVARAVIEAMREPTEAMIDASNANDNIVYGSGEMTWRTMIDAALKD